MADFEIKHVSEVQTMEVVVASAAGERRITFFFSAGQEPTVSFGGDERVEVSIVSAVLKEFYVSHPEFAAE
jgi:hypothetical protein